jgi:hypothetical protein
LISSRFWRHEQSVGHGGWAHQRDVFNGLHEDGEGHAHTKLLSQRGISGEAQIADVSTGYQSLTVKAVEVDNLVLGVLLDEKEDHM